MAAAINSRSRLERIYAPNYAVPRGGSSHSASSSQQPSPTRTKLPNGKPVAVAQPKTRAPLPQSGVNNARGLEELRKQMKVVREENQSLQARLKRLEEEKEHKLRGQPSTRGRPSPSFSPQHHRGGPAPAPPPRRTNGGVVPGKADLEHMVQQLTKENRQLRERLRGFRGDLKRLCQDSPNGMASRQLLALMRSLDSAPADPGGLAQSPKDSVTPVLLVKEQEIRKLQLEVRRLSQELQQKRLTPEGSFSRIPRVAFAGTQPKKAASLPASPASPVSRLPKPSSPVRFAPTPILPTPSPRRNPDSLRLLQGIIRGHLFRRDLLLQEHPPQLQQLQALLLGHASRKKTLQELVPSPCSTPYLCDDDDDVVLCGVDRKK